MQTLTIVVTGDTNGDGKITVTDMISIKSHLLKKSTLEGAASKAADTNGDAGISITDFIQIKAHILGKSDVEPASADAATTCKVKAAAVADSAEPEMVTLQATTETMEIAHRSKPQFLFPEKEFSPETPEPRLKKERNV